APFLSRNPATRRPANCKASATTTPCPPAPMTIIGNRSAFSLLMPALVINEVILLIGALAGPAKTGPVVHGRTSTARALYFNILRREEITFGNGGSCYQTFAGNGTVGHLRRHWPLAAIAQ